MSIISPYDYLKALTSIRDVVIAKKYMILDSKKSPLNFGEIENEIADRFKKELGFGLSDISSDDEILRYERRIDNEYSKVTGDRIIKHPIEDEIELIKNSKNIEKDYLKKCKITIGENEKTSIKKLGLKSETLKRVVWSARQITLIPSPDENNLRGENIFLVSSIIFKEKKYNVFVHLQHGAKKENELSLATFLLLDYDKTYDYNPIRCFLKILEDYGIDLVIGNKKRRFFKEEKVINQSITGDMNLVSADGLPPKAIYYITFGFKPMKFHAQLNFVYGINEGLYFEYLSAQK